MDRWMDGLMDGWMYQWKDKWMDGYIESSKPFHIVCHMLLFLLVLADVVQHFV